MKYRNHNIFLALLLFVITGSSMAQTITSVLVPKYMEGATGTNADRVPYAYRATLSGLSYSATYRFFNQVVTSADASTADGSGNCIYAGTAGSFTRTKSPGLSSSGAYGTFTTDATGSYTGWFITEPTSNARFLPGHYVYLRLALNDGASGTTVAQHLTLTDSVRIVKMDGTSSDSTGTGIYSSSGSAAAGSFVFLYDTVSGGRPIAGTYVESDGTANTTSNSYASFYASSVDGVAGAFGTIIPNQLSNGVRRIELREFSSGSVLKTASDADGVWPSGANTVNPAGGETALVLTSSDLSSITATAPKEVATEFILQQNYPNPFNPKTTIKFAVPQSGAVMLEVYNLLGQHVATLVNETRTAGSYSVSFDGSSMASGCYFYRLTAGEYTAVKKLMMVK